jgi:N-sulfoglucosamine sulfohydrolase
MTGDHGMPFPRGKSNLYDSGTRVPLAIMWGDKIAGDRRCSAFVSLTDLAPTFLSVAGINVPDSMTGRSLRKLLEDPKHPVADRASVIFGKERHVPSQEAPDLGGYPSRALRNHRYLYIRNFEPDRWPNGTPDYKRAAIPGNWFADTDNGPTKSYIVDNRDKDAAHRRAYDLSFAKRPAEELYDCASDPEQLVNLAGDPRLAAVKAGLWKELERGLRASADPRVLGSGKTFDEVRYTGGGPKHPAWKRPRKNK